MTKRIGTAAMTVGVAIAAFLAGMFVRQPAVDAQSPDRVFELRTYTTIDGRLDQLVVRHRDGAIPIFERLGMKVVGFWVATDPPQSANTLTYILSHPSREAADRAWKAFSADPARDAYEHEPIVKNTERLFLRATDFSPIQ